MLHVVQVSLANFRVPVSVTEIQVTLPAGPPAGGAVLLAPTVSGRPQPMALTSSAAPPFRRSDEVPKHAIEVAVPFAIAEASGRVAVFGQVFAVNARSSTGLPVARTVPGVQQLARHGYDGSLAGDSPGELAVDALARWPFGAGHTGGRIRSTEFGVSSTLLQCIRNSICQTLPGPYPGDRCAERYPITYMMWIQ